MKSAERAALWRRWAEEALALSERKTQDYADEEDVLRNFKLRHQLLSLLDIRPHERAEDVYLADILLKLQRLCNLLHSRRRPANESVQDTLVDMINYINLLRTALVEYEGGK